MGKALLIIVLGAGLVMARHLYTNFQTEHATTRDQVEFQEETVAREIARSAFNNAMGVIRSHGENIDSGVQAAGGVAGQHGEVLGGEYVVRAEAISGHSVRVTATGYYGGGFNDEGEYEGGTVYTMHDTYRVPVLISREWTTVDVSDFDTGSGSGCTAIYYQEIYPDRPAAQQPAPRLLYASDNNENGTLRLPPDLIVPPNTQMNFILAADDDCDQRPDIPVGDTCLWRQYYANHTFNPADWSRIRASLVVDPLAMQRTEESPWVMVEQHPGNRQRWRIGWESAARSWDRPNSDNPSESLQATKRLGYHGTGWTSRTAQGYRVLEQMGDAPDFNDQVLEIQLSPLGGAAGVAAERCRIATQNQACGITTGGSCSTPPPPPSGDEPEPEPEPEPPTGSVPPVSGTPTSSPPTTCGCPHGPPLSHKYAIMHRPPGNEANEHVICVAEPGMQTHMRQHNDALICTGD